jgi:hypothetical protein
MPWQYKIVVALSAVFVIYTVVYLPYIFLYLRLKPKIEASAPVTVSIGGLRQFGMLDPSIAAGAWLDTQNGQIWMAFTSQEKPAYGDAGGSKDTLNVRLADVKPGTGCRSWELQMSGGFEAKNDDIIAPDGQTVLRSGTWRNETPSLVYDPDDPGREWKLFAYKYFWPNDQKDAMPVARHYGVIVYKYASDPLKDWSTEQWLFSPAPGYPPPPYEQTVLLHLNQLDPSLQDVTAYARPSVIYKDHILFMTLSAFTHEVTPDKIIMIASSDHGNSWRYIGTVLQQADATAIDPTGHLAGATLLQQSTQVYLAAVLGNAQQRGVGTFILGFDDFSKGSLQRDPKTGAPVILNEIPEQVPGAGAFGGGAAAYNDACKSGMLVTEQAGNKNEFKIYHTRFKPVEENKKGEK